MPASLKKIDLPEFGEPSVMPTIKPETYAARLARAIARAQSGRLDALVVYGDREHFANLAYLTGYDPRFEEAILIVTPDRTPHLLVGNEGWSYADLAGGRFTKILWPSLSLISQPREGTRALGELLSDAGLERGMSVGIVGWKYFGPEDGVPADAIDAPAFLADAVASLAGSSGSVANATAIFMNPADGLRTRNEVDQIALGEFASTHASQALRNVLQRLEPGMTEIDAARLMALPGLPVSAHPMVSSGERAAYGLGSPTLRRIERGDPFFMALGFWGGLSARAGFVVADEMELPSPIRDYVDRLVIPYFEAVCAWYETVGIGVPGAALYEAVHTRIGDPFFGVHLNPGHYIHLDEWVSSPVSRDSDIKIASGMTLQADVIPATGSAYFTTNIEDGIAVADEAVRAEFAAEYPEAWARIEARRRFMTGVIGIDLKPEILPLSNIPAFLQPFLLSPGLALCRI